MASNPFPSAQILSLKPSSLSLTKTTKPNTILMIRRKAPAPAQAHNHDHEYSGRLVDEDMIVLRMRIHEMNMTEGKCVPPTEWMDWEKRFYTTSYDSVICDAMRCLQSYLMKSRPSVVLAMAALIVMGVTTSTALAMVHLLEIIKGVIYGLP